MCHAAFYFSEALFKGESLVHQLSISVTHGTASTLLYHCLAGDGSTKNLSNPSLLCNLMKHWI